MNKAIITILALFTSFTAANAQENLLLSALDGQISNVTIKSAPSSDSENWTEITVRYGIDCTQKLENFSYNTEFTADGRLKISTAAIVSEATKPSELSCLGFSMHEEVINVLGLFTESNIELISMTPLQAHSNGSLIYTNTNVQGIAAIDDVKIESVNHLCDPGVACDTIVNLSTTMICVDTLAGLSYRSYMKNDKLIIDLYGAQIVSTLKVRCAEIPVHFDITANSVYVESIDDIEVRLLQ